MPLEQVPDRCGRVLASHRKGDGAIVLSYPEVVEDAQECVWVLFDRAFAKISGYKLPSEWKSRRAFVPCALLSLRDPHPTNLPADSPLFLAVRGMRWDDPTLTAKQLHARLLDAATGQPTLAAVKHCLGRLNALLACPLVHGQGASDILSMISIELSLSSLLALSTTSKFVRAMLEEPRLQRSGDAIVRYHSRRLVH